MTPGVGTGRNRTCPGETPAVWTGAGGTPGVWTGSGGILAVWTGSGGPVCVGTERAEIGDDRLFGDGVGGTGPGPNWAGGPWFDGTEGGLDEV